LAEAGLGEVSVGRVRAIKGQGPPRLEAHVDRTLAEVVLSTAVEELRGEVALDAAAYLIAEGRLLQPAAELLADALHLAAVARVLNLTKGRLDVDNVQEAARRRLVELGVCEAADLALVDPEDLALDVAAALKIDEAELQDLARDFPRLWVHAGVEHRVLVERRPSPEVTLDVGKTKSAKAIPPPPGQVPHFRGLPVRWRKASRTVPLR
jgi:hypothetical protein